MYKIAIEREFDMAHIVETDTKCGRIHGHRWKLVVELEADNLRDDGMIVDFTYLKQIVDEKITDKFDHRLLMLGRFIGSESGDNISFTINGKFYKIPKKDIVVIPSASGVVNATSECLAKYIYHILNDTFHQLASDFKISKVRLYETPTAYAEYTGD